MGGTSAMMLSARNQGFFKFAGFAVRHPDHHHARYAAGHPYAMQRRRWIRRRRDVGQPDQRRVGRSTIRTCWPTSSRASASTSRAAADRPVRTTSRPASPASAPTTPAWASRSCSRLTSQTFATKLQQARHPRDGQLPPVRNAFVAVLAVRAAPAVAAARQRARRRGRQAGLQRRRVPSRRSQRQQLDRRLPHR